jgi:acetyl esterase/lipase
MLKLLLPKTPFIFKTALAHTLNFSETSSKWDLRTELTIKVLRDMLGPSNKMTPITKLQRLTTKDTGVKGKIWVSKVQLKTPEEDDARQLVFKAIQEMGDGMENWTKCDMHNVEGEWTGGRAGVSDTEPEPADVSEQEKYAKMMGEVKSKVTLLYFHGGAMYLLDPATYRHVTGRLARLTGGRVFSVRYRLAPQNAFPAALLDAFMAYLSLLNPPPDAPHDPVPASEIVFGGDSAGGLLCASLLQLILQIHRAHTGSGLPTVRWYGKAVEIPLPAGLALSSPWLDITRSLPSIEGLAKYDYLPPPSHTQGMNYPPDDAWPANPPRAELYCEGEALVHPLVSPVAAKDWSHSPPTFFGLGEEMLRDEGAVLAKRLHKHGAIVRWREFEAMPHCFAIMLDALPASTTFFDEYAKFCSEVVEAKVASSDGERLLAKTLKREAVDLDKVTQLTDEEIARHMQEGKERILKKHGAAATETRPML